VLIVDLSAADTAADLEVLRRELAAYDAELARRPSILVGTKADLVSDPVEAVRSLGTDALAVSAVDGRGLEDLTERLGDLAARAEREAPERKPTVVLRPGREAFTVVRDGPGKWLVAGRAVERWVRESDLDDERELAQLQKRLRRAGVERKLAVAGARHGEEVRIAGHVFEFLPDPAEEA
jgi:GTP-binding protein